MGKHYFCIDFKKTTYMIMRKISLTLKPSDAYERWPIHAYARVYINKVYIARVQISGMLWL